MFTHLPVYIWCVLRLKLGFEAFRVVCESAWHVFVCVRVPGVCLYVYGVYVATTTATGTTTTTTTVAANSVI